MPSSLNVAASQLPAIEIPSRQWQRWLSAAISIVLIFVIVGQLDRLDHRQLIAAIPHGIGFWIALAAYYVTLPLSEWLIYRRLWKLPVEGFAALLRKMVSNEVLMGYSGELTFYAWARRHSGLTSAPFGAIKDVSILSALAGNIVTLLMVAIAWPFASWFHGGVAMRDGVLSVGAILLVSIAACLFNRRIFSLPAHRLRFILAVHLGRIVTMTLLSALLWHGALPAVPAALWLVLAALQLLVTRLPFVPNKDLVFANVAMLVVGGGSHVGHLVAIVAGLILATHLCVGLALFAAELAGVGEKGSQAPS